MLRPLTSEFDIFMFLPVRYAGKVISLKHGAGLNKIKVKFDLHSQDKFDKW